MIGVRHFWIDMSFAFWTGRVRLARPTVALWLCLGLGMGLGMSQPAGAVGADAVGVNYPDSLRVEGVTLSLNGTGVAYRALVKLYTVGLYLPTKTSNPTEVLDMSTPRRLRFVMLQGMRVDELGKVITKGIENNSSREEFFKLIPSIRTMGEQFSRIRRLNANDTLSVEYVPKRGTVFYVNGQPAGLPIADANFFPAILRVWLGTNPTTQDLKDALLDQRAQPVLEALL